MTVIRKVFYVLLYWTRPPSFAPVVLDFSSVSLRNIVYCSLKFTVMNKLIIDDTLCSRCIGGCRADVTSQVKFMGPDMRALYI